MLSGGTHTMIHVLGVTGFNRLTALSTSKGDPTKASRPFDATRDGFVMGEGSGMIVLESLEHALARAARRLLAEVAGYGSSADAFRITDIHPEGRGGAASMCQALSAGRHRPARASRRRPRRDRLHQRARDGHEGERLDRDARREARASARTRRTSP
jgi:3-oxoacyl-[acyl-carrier-protein] synthase II